MDFNPTVHNTRWGRSGALITRGGRGLLDLIQRLRPQQGGRSDWFDSEGRSWPWIFDPTAQDLDEMEYMGI